MDSQVSSLVISIDQSTGQVTKASHQDKPEFEPGDDKEYKMEAIQDKCSLYQGSRQTPTKAIPFATDAKAHTPFLKFSWVGFRLLTARAHLMVR